MRLTIEITLAAGSPQSLIGTSLPVNLQLGLIFFFFFSSGLFQSYRERSISSDRGGFGLKCARGCENDGNDQRRAPVKIFPVLVSRAFNPPRSSSNVLHLFYLAFVVFIMSNKYFPTMLTLPARYNFFSPFLSLPRPSLPLHPPRNFCLHFVSPARWVIFFPCALYGERVKHPFHSRSHWAPRHKESRWDHFSSRLVGLISPFFFYNLPRKLQMSDT